MSLTALEIEANVWSFNSFSLKKLTTCMIKRTWRNLIVTSRSWGTKVIIFHIFFSIQMQRNVMQCCAIISICCVFRVLCYSSCTRYFCHHGEVSAYPQLFGGNDQKKKKDQETNVLVHKKFYDNSNLTSFVWFIEFSSWGCNIRASNG